MIPVNIPLRALTFLFLLFACPTLWGQQEPLPPGSVGELVRAFSQRYTVNARGDIAFAANTLMTCSGSNGNVPCSAAQNATATGDNLNNNNWNMVYVNTEGATTNSSRATLTLGATGTNTVGFAGLYWTGLSNTSNTNSLATVQFRTPGGTFQPVTGQVLGRTAANFPGASQRAYVGFADVTSRVVAGGEYAVANVVSTTGMGNQFAGWSLIVVYQNPSLPVRNLSVFDGFITAFRTDVVTTQVSGFRTPISGVVGTRVGWVLSDGDRGWNGESVTLTSTSASGPVTQTLFDAESPISQQFNSKITRDGVLVTAKVPNYANQLGFETKILNAPGVVQNNATSATVTLQSPNEVVGLSAITMAIDLYAPAPLLTKNVANVTRPGGPHAVGDILQYTVTVANNGQDNAATTDFQDSIPAFTEYVAGSLQVDGVTVPDAGAVLGTNIQFPLGPMAIGAPAKTVTFRVRITGGVNQQIVNEAVIRMFAQVSGLPTAGIVESPPILVSPPPDLSISKSHIGNFVQGQQGATYTIGVSNLSPTAKAAGQSVTVIETPPSGLTVVGIAGAAPWVCTLNTLSCTTSAELAGSSSYPPITVTVNVNTNAQVSPPQLVNRASVTGSGPDGNPDNNTTQDPTTIIAGPDPAITKSHTGNFSQGQQGALFRLRVQNLGGVPTVGAITVVDPVTPFLTIVSVTPPASGSWTCGITDGRLECNRATAMAPGELDEILVSVNVAGNAPAQILNQGFVLGGGDVNGANNRGDDTVTVDPRPDLTITKAHIGNFQQNVSGTYTILVTNVGSVATSGLVRVEDIVPPGMTASAIDGGPTWSCSLSPAPACTTSATLGANQSFPPITLTVLPTVMGSLTNVATVSGGGETNTANNRAEDITTIGAGADLVVSKSHTGDFTQGQVGATYQIRVTNRGNGATSGEVELVDALPPGLTATQITGAPDWTCTLTPLRCTTSAVRGAEQEFPLITLTVNVSPTATPGEIVNTATVAGGSDINPNNNIATDTATIRAGADLTPVKTHAPARLIQGQEVTYTVTVRNIGSAPAGPAQMVDNLPPQVSLVSFTAGPQWTCTATAASVTCNRTDAMQAGTDYLAVTIVGRVSDTATGNLVNTAGVLYPPDLDLSNNTTQDIAPVDAGADLTVSKTHTGNFVQGQIGATYTIRVTNQGGSPTSGLQSVVVTDFLPPGLTPTAIAGTGWSCVLSTLTCERTGVLAAGASYEDIILTVNVADDAPSSIRNRVIISGGSDVNPNNNEDDDTAIVNQGPDLTITKTHSGTFQRGQQGTFTITVSNAGATASNAAVIISEFLPAGLTVVSIGGTGWTCNPSGVACARSDALAPEASYPPITLTVNVADNATSSVTNRVTVAGGGDVNSTNNEATDTVDIDTTPKPNLRMSKTHTGVITRGQIGATFLLTVSNIGNAPSTGLVTVTDIVPAGMTPTAIAGLGWSCDVSTLTCTRSDALAAGASYPDITVTVNVAANTPSTLTNTATSDGGGDDTPENNTSTDTVSFDQAPGTLTCTVVAVPPTIRAEGITEQVGDIILTCTGGTPTPLGNPISKVNLQVFMNANITSRLYGNFSQAVLLIDEPAPVAGTQVPATAVPVPGSGQQLLCSPDVSMFGTGNGVGTYDGSSPSRCNMFVAQQGTGNSVIWPGVPFDPPGALTTRRLRITNLRANAATLSGGGGSSGVPSQVVAFVSASPSNTLPLNNSQQVVAFIAPGMSVTVPDLINLRQCVTTNGGLINSTTGTPNLSVSVTEGFPSSFKRRTWALTSDGETSPPPLPQNVPGFGYFTETGFYNPVAFGSGTASNPSIGLADFGTRIQIRFDNIGAGVRLFVPTVVSLTSGPVITGTLRLITAGLSTAGAGFVAAPATATLGGAPAAEIVSSAGTAVAIYEVLNSNSSAVESATVPVGVAFISNTASKLPAETVVTGAVSFAPQSTVAVADTTSPVPRFTGQQSLGDIFSIKACVCNLLFPFVTNQLGFDTGIAISNTSQDPFGTPTQSGPVTLNFFGRTLDNRPVTAQVSQTVPAGSTLTFTLSSGGNLGIQGIAGFQGYIMARAEFQYCHGFAFVTDFGSTTVAEGYVALVLDESLSSRTGSLSESLSK